jgi:hypothetical protein
VSSLRNVIYIVGLSVFERESFHFHSFMIQSDTPQEGRIEN